MNADDLHVIRELRALLAMPDAKPHELITQVQALHNHVLDQHELIRELLGYDDFSADAVAPHHLQQRAQQLQRGPHAGPHPSRRLGVLTHELPQIGGLLLESIRATHADVLAFHALHKFMREGHDVIEGEFEHLPTRQRYSLQVVRIPSEGITS
jgi:hypothetical protein